MQPLLLIWCAMASLVGARLASDGDSVASPSPPSEVECDIHANPSLHLIMDRVCEICHEMVSHQQPNMRSQCRSGCFRNSQFRACLKLFTPQRASRHSRF